MIDYDLAIFLLEDRSSPGASSKHRTGTGPYMARELLADAPEGVVVHHVYAHELESWLYILLHVQLGCTNEIDQAREQLLKDWRSVSWQTISEKKQVFFCSDKDGFDKYLDAVWRFANTLLHYLTHYQGGPST